ncbi:hypothetical protein [Kitasatospora sp. NPDC057015]|uniref:hypothetical protein n=1 Tax=Kitasatospora sp. NPDC057015 TaxID=3346001 RepID=UPI0036298F6D
MEPTYADFASTPFISNNIGIRAQYGSAPDGGHLRVAPGGRLELAFEVPTHSGPELAVALAADGVPVLSVNGEPLTIGPTSTRPTRTRPASTESASTESVTAGSATADDSFATGPGAPHVGPAGAPRPGTAPSAARTTQRVRPAGEPTATVAIPSAVLRPGRNLLLVANPATSGRDLLIRRILVDPTALPGRSERALLADPDRNRFLGSRTRLRIFTTLRTPLDDPGEPCAGVLRLALDDGTAPELRTLSWQDAEGGRGSVGFGGRMRRFQGHWVAADGRRFAYEGGDAGSEEPADGPTPGCDSFFHRLADGRPGLDLRLDAGVAPLPVELAWSDTEGRATSILFDAGWDTFVGHTRRDGRPVDAYRGRRAPGVGPGPSGSRPAPTGPAAGQPATGAVPFRRVRAEQVDFPAVFSSFAQNLRVDGRPRTPHQIQEVGDLVLPTGTLEVTAPGRHGWAVEDVLPAGRYPVAVAVEPLAEAPQAGQHARVRMLAVALSATPPVSWDESAGSRMSGHGLLCFAGRPADPDTGTDPAGEAPTTGGTRAATAAGPADGPGTAPAPTTAAVVRRLVDHARPVLEARALIAGGDRPDDAAPHRTRPAGHAAGRDPGAFAHGWHTVAQPAAGGVAVGVLVERAERPDAGGAGRVGRDAEGRPVAYVHHFPQP